MNHTIAPSQPRALLASLEQRARRRFGQHFLTDEGIVNRIVRGARIEPGDRVIEIGPGLGILTESLVNAGASLTAIELDRDLAQHIRTAFPTVTLIEADALSVDWASLCVGAEGKVKIVSNLPYNIGTTLTMQLVRKFPLIRSVTVMLQLEVIQRMCAEPGSKTYGALTVELAARALPTFLMKVSPHHFHPRPGVDSAVVRIEPRPEMLGVAPPDLSFFDAVVRAAFGMRRKTIENALGARFGKDIARSAIQRAAIPQGRRAEQLDLASFQGLTRELLALGAGAVRDDTGSEQR